MISRKIKYKCGCEYTQKIKKQYAYLMERIDEEAAGTDCDRCKRASKIPDDLKEKIRKDPYYYVYEGGSDGTLGHVEYHAELGALAKAASEYAAQILEDKGETW